MAALLSLIFFFYLHGHNNTKRPAECEGNCKLHVNRFKPKSLASQCITTFGNKLRLGPNAT